MVNVFIEVLHKVRVKKLKYIFFKIDFENVVNWDFLIKILQGRGFYRLV
jgi:hypothetical protein